jgi:hypothetical protein
VTSLVNEEKNGINRNEIIYIGHKGLAILVNLC